MYLSIIIPTYNSEKTIVPLLESIKKSKGVDFGEVEVIIVDDYSRDETFGRLLKYKSYKFYKNYKVIRLEKNSGPAHARNVGVKYAKGKVVLFLDSDVVLYKESLFEVIRSFKEDPDIHALTGVWDKKQNSRKFFPKFKALRDWSYWINERDPRNYYYLFSTRVAAIDRKLFLRLGGFDETYKAALVEDIELTYRIARRYAVLFNPKVIVHHEFEDFTTVAKKYFWRSYFWSRIYRERKKFDPVATTGKEAITTISAGMLIILVISYVVIRFMIYDLGFKNNLISMLEFLNLTSLILILFIHLFGVRKFLWFVAGEEGIVFAVKSFFTGMALYLAILAGAGYSFLATPRYSPKSEVRKRRAA